MTPTRSLLPVVCISCLTATWAFGTPTCVDLGYGQVPGVKPNKLFLYFPTAADATYPDFSGGEPHTEIGRAHV